MNAPDPLQHAPAGPVAFGDFLLDMAQARLLRAGAAVALTGRPLQVLALLAAHPGRLVSKDEVLDAVWGHRHVTESVLKGAVNVLREALDDDARAPRCVETVPRRGYRFVAAVTPVTPVQPAPHAGPSGASSPEPSPSISALPAHLAAGGAIGNLPAQFDPLIGRADELQAVLSLMAVHRLVTLSGLGGVGKTRLALAAAGAAGPLPDGVWLLRLDELSDPAQLVLTLAGLLQLGSTAAGSVQALARAVSGLRLRLVLDNAEHLVGAVAELVSAVLKAAPGVQLLVTSQLPLRLGAERMLAVAPLGLPPDVSDSAPAPAAYAAAELLCVRIAQQRAGWQPVPADHADIAAICRALDGVPLALELAAARVPLLGLAGVRARLDERFTLLSRGARDASARHRTLAAALDWTFSLLTPVEREAMQRLAVFGGSFGIDDAEGVLQGLWGEAPLDVIDELHQRALIVNADEQGHAVPRLRLYDSVRRHALAGLGQSGHEADARSRLLAWLLQRVEQLYRRAVVEPQQHWLPQLQRDVDSLRAALGHGLSPQASPQDQVRGVMLAACSLHFWYFAGRRAEGERWRGLARETAARHSLTPAQQGLLLFASADFGTHAMLGPPAEALHELRQARPLLIQAGDRLRLHMSYYDEFFLSLRVEGAVDRQPLAQAMEASIDPGWPPLAGRYFISMQALIARDADDLSAYLAHGQRLLQLVRAQDAQFEIGFAAAFVGQALQLLGRTEEACEHYAAAVDEVRAAGWLRIRTPLVLIGASLALRRRLDDDCRRRVVEALRLLGADGMVWWMADALPWAAWHDGRLHDAARLKAWADAQMAQRGETRGFIFQRMHEEMQAALASRGVVLRAGEPLLTSDAAAVDLALGPGTAAAVLPPAMA